MLEFLCPLETEFRMVHDRAWESGESKAVTSIPERKLSSRFKTQFKFLNTSCWSQANISPLHYYRIAITISRNIGMKCVEA